jgi:ABC-type transport system substrate-binding protein
MRATVLMPKRSENSPLAPGFHHARVNLLDRVQGSNRTQVAWHDKRLRLAVNLALDRKRIYEAACLGFCPPAGAIVPRVMDYALQVEAPPYVPEKASAVIA